MWHATDSIFPKSWNLCFGLVNMSWNIFNMEGCALLPPLVTMIMRNLCTHVRVFWMFSFTSKNHGHICCNSHTFKHFHSHTGHKIHAQMHTLGGSALCVIQVWVTILRGVKDGQIDHLITYTLLPLRHVRIVL